MNGIHIQFTCCRCGALAEGEKISVAGGEVEMVLPYGWLSLIEGSFGGFVTIQGDVFCNSRCLAESAMDQLEFEARHPEYREKEEEFRERWPRFPVHKDRKLFLSHLKKGRPSR